MSAEELQTNEAAIEQETEEDKKAADPTFKQMVMAGYNYRQEHDFEMFGHSVTIELQPLTDDVYQPLLEKMEEDLGEERFERLMSLKQEGAIEDAEDIDKLQDSEEFGMDLAIGQIGALRLAAKWGIDPDSLEGVEDRSEVINLVNKMVNQKSILIGMEVMDITGAVGDMDDFPGARGR